MSRLSHNDACQYLYSIVPLLEFNSALLLHPAIHLLVTVLEVNHRCWAQRCAWRTTPVGEGEITT